MVVDGRGQFVDVRCGVPGSMHDARMFNESSLCRRIDTGDILNECVVVPGQNIVLPQVIICDKAYPVRKGLMPVYKKYTNTPAYVRLRRKRFNDIMTRGRVIVENAIGRLYMRFSILDNRFRIKKKNFSSVFLASVALSNFLNETGSFLRDEDVETWRTCRQVAFPHATDVQTEEVAIIPEEDFEQSAEQVR